MEKIRIEYKGSGVRSMCVFSDIFIFLSIVGGIVIIGSMVLGGSSMIILISIGGIILSAIMAVLFRCMATIAENALIQKQIAKTKYEIVEV